MAWGVIGAAMEVHRELGPGLLEAIYEECLCVELTDRAIEYERQRPIAVIYKGTPVDIRYRIDLMVEGALIVELKASAVNHALHAAQLLTYLKLTGIELGLLLNFGRTTLREGIVRVVNGLPE